MQSAPAPSSRPTRPTQPREWRITEALDPSEVDAQRIVERETLTPVAYVEQPGLVRLILPDGEAHEAEPFVVQAWQKGGRLVGVRLLFPAESLEAAIARAAIMLDEWGIATPEHGSRLEKWRVERQRLEYRPNTQSDPLHVSFNSAADLRFPRQVEIRPSFDMDRPWYVAVGISFYGERERQAAREAATRPATQAADR